jgi:NADH:ubiquinone oxidoreductase subunit F (NADH-binding)
MTTVGAPPNSIRLLAGTATDAIPGGRLDLSAHLSVHGPLPFDAPRGMARDLVGLLTDAGLRGRGGAGFPTARKVDTVGRLRRRPTVVVNAMEGEPASRKDHVLATRVPHLVLDGAEAVSRFLGAREVVVCVAADDVAAARSIRAAVVERGRPGDGAPSVEVVTPPGRYVGGEESALASWLDGRQGLPTYRPERPAILRVAGRPTLVDNAETLAQVGLIVRYGPDWFRSVGTADAPGTSLVTVSGRNGGPRIVEVPYGTPVSLVLAMGGADAEPAAVLVGGYGGAWLDGSDIDVPYDPASLDRAGAVAGVGVMVAVGRERCGLAEAARVAAWMASEGAGQCGPCAFGLPAIADDLSRLAFGRARSGDARRLWDRLGAVEGRGACRHPDGVARMVRSALRVFAADLDRHIGHGPCDGSARQTVMALPGRHRPAGASGIGPAWRR